MRIGKYEFDSREAAQSKIDALGTATDEDGNEYPTHKNTIVHLGNIVLEQGEYDSDGNETKAPVTSSKWHIDVLWAEEEAHPYGWATRAVDLDNEGSHSFFGVSYVANKM
jgi:hypothetical protein